MKAHTGFLGLRTAKYHAPDLARARAWYSEVLGIAPYFDEPFYVGFNVGGFELGLDPDAASGGPPAFNNPASNNPETNVVVYWGVTELEQALSRLIALGATPHAALQDVGEGIRVASVLDPFGNVLGIIENPHFKSS